MNVRLLIVVTILVVRVLYMIKIQDCDGKKKTIGNKVGKSGVDYYEKLALP